jgi:hypothetical protein
MPNLFVALVGFAAAYPEQYASLASSRRLDLEHFERPVRFQGFLS